jgi:hypothetical protein
MTAAIVEVKRDTAVPVSTQQQQLPPVTGVSATAAPEEKTATLPSPVLEQKQSGVVTAAKQKKKTAAVVDPLHYSPPKRPLRTGCKCKVPKQSHQHLLTECAQFQATYSVQQLVEATWVQYGPDEPWPSRERVLFEAATLEQKNAACMNAVHDVVLTEIGMDFTACHDDQRLYAHRIIRALPELLDPDCAKCVGVVRQLLLHGYTDHCDMLKQRFGIAPKRLCPWRCSSGKDD